MGTLHGWDVYGRPDFKQVEWTHDQPRCISPSGERSRMPLQQGPIFREMSREGFLRGKYSIKFVRDSQAPADTDSQFPEAGPEHGPGDQPQGGSGDGDQRAA